MVFEHEREHPSQWATITSIASKFGMTAETLRTPRPGEMVGAEGRYVEGGDPENDYEGGTEKRAAILIGPEFGTVSRPDLVQAAREAAEADFDVLISCAFNYEALASEFNKLGRVPVLKGCGSGTRWLPAPRLSHGV